jgi:hypothetical protein
MTKILTTGFAILSFKFFQQNIACAFRVARLMSLITLATSVCFVCDE